MKCQISDDEREYCRRVIKAFSEIYERQDIYATEVGQYGFVVLNGIDYDTNTFINADIYDNGDELFERLFTLWRGNYLYHITKGTELEGMSYDDIMLNISIEQAIEIKDKEEYFKSKMY